MEEGAGVGVAVGRKGRSNDDVAVARDPICAPQASPTVANKCRAECRDGEEVGHVGQAGRRREAS